MVMKSYMKLYSSLLITIKWQGMVGNAGVHARGNTLASRLVYMYMLKSQCRGHSFA